ncbi:MAG TPA: DNA internalization-related competence protein ComEC/Rec2 [Myxococcales bacterium]|nr:DNA internalization-related competence protein ComEC/Rec2 [Myxococcales bacterium]
MRRWGWRDLGLRPTFFPATGLALGAWLGRSTGPGPGIFLLGLAAIFAAWSAHRRTGAHLLLLAGTGVVGFGLATLEASPVVPPAALERPGQPVRLEGVVERVEQAPDASRLLLAVARAAGEPARFRARLYGPPSAAGVRPGDRVLLDARLKPEEPAANPGQLDLSGPRRGAGLLFHGAMDPERTVVVSPAPQAQRWLESARRQVSEAIRPLAPSPEAAALYGALATGDRAALPDEVEEAFARSGLAHVLSVSGLHVAALALLAFAVARRLLVLAWPGARTRDARALAGPLALPIVWGYVAFTGWQPPAVRSAAMLSLMLLGFTAGRRADGLNALATSALLLLALEPSGAGDLSLQLSFAAVAALILVAPAVRAALPVPPPEPSATRRWRYRAQKAREAVLSLLCAGAAVTATSLPLCAQAFHRASVAGVLANVAGAPLVAALTVLAAAGGAASLLAGAWAAPLLWLGTRAAALLLWLARWFAAFPWAAPSLPSYGALLGFLHVAGVLAFALGRGRARWVGLLVPASLAAALLYPAATAPPLSVTFLSVGHGDAIVVSSRGQHALIDGGGVPGGADVGRKIVLPFLWEQRVDHLALAVLSHPHPDHALGLISAVAALPTSRVWVPAGAGGGVLLDRLRAAAAARGAEVEEVERGHAPVRVGDAEIDVLGPPPDRVLLEGVNDRSVVLRVRLGAASVLLTGDIESAAEAALGEDAGPATVLKAPHHGSRTSSTPDFLARAAPGAVVFSVGAHNRFGLPAPEVVDRARATGATCLRTDADGAVRFETDGRRFRLLTYPPGGSAWTVRVEAELPPAHLEANAAGGHQSPGPGRDAEAPAVR